MGCFLLPHKFNTDMDALHGFGSIGSTPSVRFWSPNDQMVRACSLIFFDLPFIALDGATFEWCSRFSFGIYSNRNCDFVSRISSCLYSWLTVKYWSVSPKYLLFGERAQFLPATAEKYRDEMIHDVVMTGVQWDEIKNVLSEWLNASVRVTIDLTESLNATWNRYYTIHNDYAEYFCSWALADGPSPVNRISCVQRRMPFLLIL